MSLHCRMKYSLLSLLNLIPYGIRMHDRCSGNKDEKGILIFKSFCQRQTCVSVVHSTSDFGHERGFLSISSTSRYRLPVEADFQNLK